MIACVEKTAQNADFYQIIDYLTGCSINYSLLVDPDLIGPWLQQFWATASLRVINDVPHIRAMVAGKKILISEETIRADLLFDDAHGVDCFPKQVIWDLLRDIGYEGNLAQLTFSKPLFSPQWKKSDETEEINIEEKEASNVKSGDTEELDLETVQSTARQSTITPRTLNFSDEAGPSSPIRPTQNIEPEEQFKVDEVLADISRPRGLSIPGPIQSQPQPQQPSQATDPKDKGKGILVEEPKKKKLTLQQIRALETTNDEEVARKIQAEWDAEEERKRKESNDELFKGWSRYKNLQKLKVSTDEGLYDKDQNLLKNSYKEIYTNGLEEGKQMLQERKAKRLLKKRKATIFEEQPSKKLKLRTETVDELRNYLRIVDFEKNAQEKESLEGISMIIELQVIDSPDGEYLIIHRANNHFRAFDTLWEILHILDR
ncbi:hypothetical protein Tco_0905236 [Tanacetum coccineum]